MNHNTELHWWVDHTGSAYTSQRSSNAQTAALATGKLYPDSNAGVITTINDQPAQLSMISQELLDVLHTRFPGTRWWIKDIDHTHQPNQSTDQSTRQAAS